MSFRRGRGRGWGGVEGAQVSLDQFGNGEAVAAQLGEEIIVVSHGGVNPRRLLEALLAGAVVRHGGAQHAV